MKVYDLRSDTVTHPTEEMRAAMARAEVGDDVMGEDPSVNQLEEMAAQMVGKEAAVLVASGTMGNLVSILAQTQRGDEVVAGNESHIFWNECGGASVLGGLQLRQVANDYRGMMDPQEVERAIRLPGNIHFPRSSLLCLENTHNRCSGGILTPSETKALCDVAHAHGMQVHLDGARIFNASVALEVPVTELTNDVDDLTFCLSKGLSAPAGSLVCGSRDFVHRARKYRKMVGGGMRQVGVLAAAGMVALSTCVERLADDHGNAHRLAQGLAEIPGLSVDPDQIRTNIVFVEVASNLGPTPEFIRRMAEEGVKVSYPGECNFRMVTNRHITAEDVAETLSIVSRVARESASAAR